MPGGESIPSRPARSDRLAVGLRVAWAVIGVALLATSSLAWIRTGPGSTFSGLDLADALRRNEFVPDVVGVVVSAVVYGVVASGAVILLSAVVDQDGVLLVRGAACATATGAFLLIGLAGWFPWRLWGTGPAVATVSYLLGLALTTVQIRTRPPRRADDR